MLKVNNTFAKLFPIKKRLTKRNSLRSFSAPSFKNNNKDKLKNLIFRLFNYLINKTLSKSNVEKIKEYLEFCQEFDQQLEVLPSPSINIKRLQLILISPTIIHVSSHIILLAYVVETKMLGIPLNESTISFFRFFTHSSSFYYLMFLSTFLFFLLTAFNSYKRINQLNNHFNEQKKELKKNGTYMNKIQRRAMFTVIAKAYAKPTVQLCVACAGIGGSAVMTYDAGCEMYYGRRPSKEMFDLANGIITQEQYDLRKKYWQKYESIRSNHNIGAGYAERLSDEYLKNQIKPTNPEYELAKKMAEELNFQHKEKK